MLGEPALVVEVFVHVIVQQFGYKSNVVKQEGKHEAGPITVVDSSSVQKLQAIN